MADPPPYFLAIEQVYPSVTATGVLALLRGAERAGLVDGWLPGGDQQTSYVDAADAIGADVLLAITDALTACEVLVVEDGAHRLAPAWAVVLSRTGLISRADLLGRFEVEAKVLEALGQGSDYWSLSDADRVTYARGISPDPTNPMVVTMLSRGALADPDLAALREGGTLLELGCGVAGRSLALLQGIPALHVVGVELAEDLAAEARRRAEILGVADRFEVVVGDAVTFSRPGVFDVAFWSQFFFPTASRRGALEVLLESLRPGGIVEAPLAADFSTLRADPGGQQARSYAISRVIHASWGVPERTADQLAAELEDAGFVDVEIRGGGAAGPQRAHGVRP